MNLTLGNIVDSVAGILKSIRPDVPVYANPNQQGTETPCFFVFFMPTQMEDEIGRRERRVIGIDIVYLTRKNIPDAYEQMSETADQLDEVLEFVPYTVEGVTAKIRTFDREWKIDDEEMHYQFTLKAMVSIPDDSPGIDEMEYKGGTKDAEGSKNS